MVIAIDGPAGAGKSTVARGVAQTLGFTYLNSGAMYRCVALAALAAPEAEPAALARAVRIALGATGGGHRSPNAAEHRSPKPAGHGSPDAAGRDPQGQAAERVLLDGRDVSTAIRAVEVSEMASRVAADPAVRAALVAKQRELIAAGDWVAEGRDIGTVVAPDAELKIFLTADPRERARRRAVELGADVEAVLAEQTLRDARDTTREHSPLKPAPDAVELDTSGLAIAQVVERIAAFARGASRSA